MKIYARTVQENEEDELIVFDIEPARLFELEALCKIHDLSEACIAMPKYERIAWPEGELPTDGFFSEETKSEHLHGAFDDIEFSEAHSVDLNQSLTEVLHVGRNGAVHIELRGGPAGEWWSEGLDLAEIARYAAL